MTYPDSKGPILEKKTWYTFRP